MGQGVVERVSSLFAQGVVAAAEPRLRAVIREERTRLSDALLSGVPLAAAGAVALAATSQVMPDVPWLKFAGYAASAGLVAAGAIVTRGKLVMAAEEAPTVKEAPQSVQEAASAFVAAAEPGMRSILSEERSRLVDAAKYAVPFAAAAVGAFILTAFAVGEKDRAMKAVGYSASALLAGAGAWAALEREAA